MSDTRENHKYKNESKEEMLAFTGGDLMAACMDHKNPNVYKLYNGETVNDADEKTAADRDLFAKIISMISDQRLKINLATMYKGKGMDALQAIKDEWEHGSADDRESNSCDDYFGMLFGEVPSADITAEEFTTMCNKLYTARAEVNACSK